MMKRLNRWYNGETKIMEFENDPSSSVVIFPAFYTEYHWSAKIARALVAFYLKHWQWLWLAVVAVATLYYTYLGAVKP